MATTVPSSLLGFGCEVSPYCRSVKCGHASTLLIVSKDNDSASSPFGNAGRVSRLLFRAPFALDYNQSQCPSMTQHQRHNRYLLCSSNICWQDPCVTREQRRTLLHQKGCVVWFTGLSGSGKSTVAFAVDKFLTSMGKFCYVLDGDNLRHGLCKNLGFSAADRQENIRRVGEVAKLFAEWGTITCVSLISPYKKDRDSVRELIRAGEFIEVYMNVPLEVCERRDSKGLYKLARAGKITGFTGIDDPYEKPVNPEIFLKDINDEGVAVLPDDMARTVIRYLADNGFLCG